MTAACMALLLAVTLGCARSERSYYLESGKYAQGIAALSKKYAKDPWNPELNYYLGRYNLALDNAEKAIGYLKRATILAPDSAENHFWLSTAYLAVGEPLAEERALERALALDSGHAQARLALAHNLLGQGLAAKALTHYDLALSVAPQNSEALWGRAQALARLGRGPEQAETLRACLRADPRGPWSVLAAQNLNALGDYSWRTHVLGRQSLALPAVEFELGDDKPTGRSLETLARVAKVLGNDPALRIHVVTFVNGDRDLARKRTLAVASTLRRIPAGPGPGRLILSWLDTPQRLHLEGGTHELDESVIFLTDVRKGA